MEGLRWTGLVKISFLKLPAKKNGNLGNSIPDWRHNVNTITDAQKIYELSKIWKEAAYNFAFWDKVDIDWDEEYKKALVRVLETKDLYDY